MHKNDLLQNLADLEQQREEAAAQSADLSRQLNAAFRREEDLNQQLSAAQAEMAKLGFMQLGKKMMVKAEQENIRKKLMANKQLQESLAARLAGCSRKLQDAEKQIAAIQEAPAAEEAAPVQEEPAILEEPVVEEESAIVDEPVVEDEPAIVDEPVILEEEPAQPVPVIAPRAPAAVKPRRSVSAGQPKSPRTPRAPRIDASLSAEEQTAQLLARLEAFYPEKQVFALDSVCPDLNVRLNVLALRVGCANTAALLQQHGYAVITGPQGRLLRSGKYCVPGDEPEVIRPLLASVLRRLEKHYPERVITRSIQHDHKSLAQDVSGLYQYLGYDSTAAFLAAYGYRYQVTAGGRPATDAQALLAEIRKGYADGEKPRTIAQLMADYPKLAHSIKTLQNQAPTRFGMPLKQYLAKEGILAPTGKGKA